MLFFYIRHGDPIYDPNSLTPLGERQAEALSKRLALYGIDKVYASTSNRAILTAKPTCDILKLQPELLDFANENHAWSEMTIERDDGKGVTWLFQHKEIMELFCSKEIRDLGDKWFNHPRFSEYNYEKGVNRVYDGVDNLFKTLGYEHERYTGRYKVIKPNEQRVALFAHQGFGLMFLSSLLDIPYPAFTTHFDLSHSSMTVIEFPETEGYCIPRILTMSSDSHIYKEGLPTKYNNYLYF